MWSFLCFASFLFHFAGSAAGAAGLLCCLCLSFFVLPRARDLVSPVTREYSAHSHCLQRVGRSHGA